MSRFIAVIFLVFTFCFPAISFCEIVDRIIAIVNDDILTLKEAEKYVQIETQGKYVSVNEYFRNIQLREKISALIEGILIKQQARKLKINVSDKEVDRIVENIKKQYLIDDEQLKSKLKEERINYKDFYEGIRTNTLRGRVMAQVISPDVIVTDKTLKEYYEAHTDEFRDEEYKLQQIFISNRTINAQRKIFAAYNLLKEGTPFDEVAKKFSEDPSASHGGDIGYVKKGELVPGLKEAIGTLTPGGYTEILTTPYGFHVLRLAEVKKGDTLPFDDVKGKIHERIVVVESEKRYKEYMEKLKQSAYIEVKI
ncbi:MAG: peptidyl-prolyl cis-trans isomerase [Proteobacteria bacterium]|nr:peptidyl-prolyl cis-trans isomerase [Pseudomonadota bacterium]